MIASPPCAPCLLPLRHARGFLMAIIDGRLIDPTEKELARVLGKAMRSANTENRDQDNRMTRDAEFWGRFAQDVLRSGPEGRRPLVQGRAGGAGGDRRLVDRSGRAQARPHSGAHAPAVRAPAPRNGNARTPAVVARLPGGCAWRSREAGRRTVLRGVPVRCGRRAGSLGWMGDTCGPCFDRRADGGTPSGPRVRT